MRRVRGLSLLGSAVLLCVTHAQQPAPSDKQTFRSGVDLIQIDVSVLDEQRSPVRGLTAADFTVLDGDVVRPIVSFAAVDLPPAAIAPNDAVAAMAPDVTVNDTANGRLIVILLSQSIRQGSPAVQARQLATAAVDALAPNDMAAVLTTNQGPLQNFTADRSRLRAAIAAGYPGMNQPENSVGRGDCPCGVCSLDAIADVAEALRGTTERRKSLLFIGESIPLDLSQLPPSCFSILRIARERLLRATQSTHLTVHALDPNGLETTSVGADVASSSRALWTEKSNRASLMRRHESLRELADLTGGRVVLNTNAPTDHIRTILDEVTTYYLSEMTLPTKRVTAILKVKFALERRLGLWLPRTMDERYVGAGGITGNAEYSDYRQFRVDTSTEIGKPPS